MSKQNTEIKSVKSIDHVKTKPGMWIGSIKPSEKIMYLLNDNIIEKKSIVYSDGLLKIIDEILVNCYDHYIKTLDMSKNKQVKNIFVDFNNDGRFVINNDGDGIPVKLTTDCDDKPMYIPTMCFTKLFAGSNLESDEQRTTGGTNGVGAVLANLYSSEFIVETTDIENKLYFKQIFSNRLETIQEPIISKSNNKHKGTTISFVPCYNIFDTDLKKDIQLLNNIFKTRCLFLAISTGINIYYNGLLMKENINTISNRFTQESIKIRLDGKYPWDVIIGNSGGSFESLSLINGIVVYTGIHIKYLKDIIVTSLTPKVTKLVSKYITFKPNIIYNNLFIFIVGTIPNPEFSSQSKTDIGGSNKKYQEYKLSTNDINKIYNLIEPSISQLFLSKLENKKEKKDKLNDIEKYYSAENIGHPNSVLFIPEGDSACTMVRSAFSMKDLTNINSKYHGIYVIGGVPMNAIKSSSDNKIPQKKLLDNERLSNLARVINLKFNLKYETDDEISTLNYKTIIITVDQDLDGIGQICSLIAFAFLGYFWPSLLRKGIVKILLTPIIRAYPKNTKLKVLEFFNNEEYTKWSKNNNIDAYSIKYYKGLATHSSKETFQIFKQYRVSTFYYDIKCESTTMIYYGADTNKRKTELVIPIDNSIDRTNSVVNVSDHLNTSTKEYQLDNLIRKLPHFCDGLNITGRKILNASLRKNLSTAIKVFQFCGYIAETENYHHGNGSLEESIIKKAQSFVGSNNIPLLDGIGQFGSRLVGGSDHGAPRYISVKLNPITLLLFPKKYIPLLPKLIEDGEISTPEYFVPMTCLSVLETKSLPANGWKFEGYARDHNSVKDYIIGLINDSKDVPIIPFWKNRWKGNMESIVSGKNKCSYFVGTWNYDTKKNTINITELPFQVWSDDYIKEIKKKEYVKSVTDYSSETSININIKLNPNTYELITDVEQYFNLKKKQNKHLNMIYKNNIVKEYKKYTDIIKDWYTERVNIENKYVFRQIILLELKLEFLNEVYRFIINCDNYDMSKKTEEELNELLQKENYKIFDRAALFNSDNILTEDLKSRITNGSYDYLLNIKTKDRLLTAKNKLLNEIKENKKELEEIKSPNYIKNSILQSLEKVHSEIEVAINHPNYWKYKENIAKFSD